MTKEPNVIPPKGKWVQLLASFKIGEQRVYDRKKGALIRGTISRIGVSDQFTTWGVYDGEKLTTDIVVHRVA